MGHTWLGKFLVMSLSWAPGRKNTPVCGLGLTGISGLPFLSKGSCQLLLPFFPPQLKRLWYSWHMPLGRWWKFTFTRVVWCSSRRVELLACFFCLQHGFRDSSLHALLFVGRGEEEMRSIVRFNQPLTEHVYICVYLYISNVCVHKIIVPLPFVDIIAFPPLQYNNCSIYLCTCVTGFILLLVWRLCKPCFLHVCFFGPPVYTHPPFFVFYKNLL